MADINTQSEQEIRSKELDIQRELELAKINGELALKQKELILNERKVALEESSQKGKVSSELKVGSISVIISVVTALGTFIAAYYGGFFDVEKTNAASKGSIDLAKLQFSNELIKNALSSNNPANSLLFYADIGLLEGVKPNNVKAYADEENKRIKEGDQGPSLLPNFANAAKSNSTLWLNEEIIKAISPDASQEIIVALTTLGNYILMGFEINKNEKRLSAFLGQTAYETNGFKLFVENANYSETALLNVFPSKFNAKDAKNYAHKPEQILNKVYSNRMGNGPESSGDGWRFRGRGFILMTGRKNYEEMTNETGINLINNPDLASDPNVALLIAAIYWYKRDLNTFADKNENQVESITKRIAGGLSGIESRIQYTKLAAVALKEKK